MDVDEGATAPPMFIHCNDWYARYRTETYNLLAFCFDIRPVLPVDYLL